MMTVGDDDDDDDDDNDNDEKVYPSPFSISHDNTAWCCLCCSCAQYLSMAHETCLCLGHGWSNERDEGLSHPFCHQPSLKQLRLSFGDKETARMFSSPAPMGRKGSIIMW